MFAWQRRSERGDDLVGELLVSLAVMRLGAGQHALLFNSRDGEWLAEITDPSKRGGTLTCVTQTAPLQPPPLTDAEKRRLEAMLKDGK